MSTTTWARLSRAGAVAAVGALAVALLPTVAAQAVGPAAPKFAYRSTVGSDVALSVNDAATAGTAAQLTPPGYQVYGYDASDNGQTWAACMSAGAASANSYDRTYALVLTHTDGATTSSRSLSTFCEASPVVSRNGSTVWWFADDHLYKFVADYTDPANITGTTTVVSTGQFVRAADAAGDPTENALALAISTDGANASVMFTNGTTIRVRSAQMTTDATKKGAVQYSTTNTAALPKPSTFVYLDATSLLFATVDTTANPQAIHNVTLDTPANTTTGVAVGVPAVTDPSLDGLYDVRPNGANLWGWKDVYTGTTFDHTELFYVSGGVATDSGTARTDGATTYSYVPVASTPPDLQPVTNKAVAHPYFATSAALFAYKKKAAYSSYNLYETDPLGGAFATGSAAEVDRGLLEIYYSGLSTQYAPLRTTSGASVFAIGSRWYNGYTNALVRNTWFRWSFPGDYFTAASAPIKRQVKVMPAIGVKKAVSGRYTTVYGTATRAAGTGVLQRLTSRGWRSVTSAKLVKKSNYLSTYTFGRRALPKGSYRVLTVADVSWALGASVAFRV